MGIMGNQILKKIIHTPKKIRLVKQVGFFFLYALIPIRESNLPFYMLSHWQYPVVKIHNELLPQSLSYYLSGRIQLQKVRFSTFFSSTALFHDGFEVFQCSLTFMKDIFFALFNIKKLSGWGL